MTKKEMLKTMLNEYIDDKSMHKGLIKLSTMEENETRKEELKALANEYWFAAFTIEQLANKMFPNIDFFELYLDATC